MLKSTSAYLYMHLFLFSFLQRVLTESVFSNMMLQGELSLSSDIELLQAALFYDSVPESWSRLAYPSTKTLALWYSYLHV